MVKEKGELIRYKKKKREKRSMKRKKERGRAPHLKSISSDPQAHQIKGRSSLDKIRLIAALEEANCRQKTAQKTPVGAAKQKSVEKGPTLGPPSRQPRPSPTTPTLPPNSLLHQEKSLTEIASGVTKVCLGTGLPPPRISLRYMLGYGTKGTFVAQRNHTSEKNKNVANKE